MFCPKCGAQQVEGARFCQNCGMNLAQGVIVTSGAAPVTVVAYAGFWRRFAAYIIDGIILYAAQFIIGLILGWILLSSGIADDPAVMVVSYIAGIVIAWLYWAISESSSKQATPGKMALRIIVTDANGKRISFGRATGRMLAKIISGLILLIGYIMIAFTSKKQGLHDMIADTLVVLK